VVSLAQSEGRVVALAVLTPSNGRAAAIERVGIDIEAVRGLPDGFADRRFSAAELSLVANIPTPQREEWLIRCWCARKAALKALDGGLVHGLGAVVIAAIDAAREVVAVRLASTDSGLVAGCIAVKTGRHGDLVVAATLGEPFDDVALATQASHRADWATS
jgi:phosphopantetheinyl transferase